MTPFNQSKTKEQSYEDPSTDVCRNEWFIHWQTSLSLSSLQSGGKQPGGQTICLLGLNASMEVK